MTSTATSASTFVWNGAVCATCGAGYVDAHVCDSEVLRRRGQQLIDLANRPLPASRQIPADRTASCPCRPENGGSGACGCILGGTAVTC